ncbi:MAG: amidohydrolase family protein [Planctomycetes bacterium]|nr:amidohydrolase family protein [Planctomycetota bacterium]
MNPILHDPKRKAGRSISIEGVLAGVAARRRIEIEDGCIAAVLDPNGRANLVLDDSHRIFPGFVDGHVHAREDATGRHRHKEDFRSAGLAAIRGGVVAFAEMPNNPEPPVDEPSYAAKEALTAHCPVDVILYAGIRAGTRPLARPVPYKAYLGPTTGTLGFRDAGEAREALAPYAGCWVTFHAESPLAEGGTGRGARSEDGRSPEAEEEGIALALSLARDLSLHAHVAHVSTAAGLDRIRAARRGGLAVTCEVTPHHLFFDRASRPRFARAAWLTMNPPLREPSDRAALLQALADGEIDWVATDHAPHLASEKDRGAAGVPGLDTLGGFAAWLLAEGLSEVRLAEAFSGAPGRFLDRFRPEGWGRIEPGAIGSLTILRVDAPWTVRAEDLRTRCGWSPFEGVSLPGDAAWTVVRGIPYASPARRSAAP